MQPLLKCDVPTLPPFKMQTCRLFVESLGDSLFGWELLNGRACSILHLSPFSSLLLFALLQSPPSDCQ